MFRKLAAKEEFLEKPADAVYPFHVLVELIEVPDTFVSENGHGIFWGKRHPDVKVLMSNNR
jgi:hypothetical protein